VAETNWSRDTGRIIGAALNFWLGVSLQKLRQRESATMLGTACTVMLSSSLWRYPDQVGGRTVSTQTYWESIRASGTLLLDTFKSLIREGNVRRVIIKQDGRTIAEFPLTVGVVGAALAPPLAAVGAIAALVTECTIEVERTKDETGQKDHGAA
jgi:hypothetical protein